MCKVNVCKAIINNIYVTMAIPKEVYLEITIISYYDS